MACPADSQRLPIAIGAPQAVRLPEVEAAVLAVLDERGVAAGQAVPFVEIEVAMDARGYPVRWVSRAVASLVKKGALASAGASMVQRLDANSAPGKRGKHYRTAKKVRSRLSNL